MARPFTKLAPNPDCNGGDVLTIVPRQVTRAKLEPTDMEPHRFFPISPVAIVEDAGRRIETQSAIGGYD